MGREQEDCSVAGDVITVEKGNESVPRFYPPFENALGRFIIFKRRETS